MLSITNFNMSFLLDFNYLDFTSTLFVVLFLIIASCYDLKYLKIPNKLNLAFFFIRLFLIPVIGFNIGNVFGLVVGGLLILIPAMIVMIPMGGDIKMMSVIGFYIGVQNILLLMVVSVILLALYYGFFLLVKKEKDKVPLAPFVGIAFTMLTLARLLIS